MVLRYVVKVLVGEYDGNVSRVYDVGFIVDSTLKRLISHLGLHEPHSRLNPPSRHSLSLGDSNYPVVSSFWVFLNSLAFNHNVPGLVAPENGGVGFTDNVHLQLH